MTSAECRRWASYVLGRSVGAGKLEKQYPLTRVPARLARDDRKSRSLVASLLGMAALRQFPELHLILIEPWNRQYAALRVDADVRGSADAGDEPRELAALNHVDRRIRPARNEDAAVAENLDAIVLPRTVDELRGRVPRSPRLHVLATEWREQISIVRGIEGDA